MMHRDLLRQCDLPEEQLLRELTEVFGEGNGDWLTKESRKFEEGQILTGRVLHVTAEGVRVDVGSKSEGVVELREWYDEGVGQVVPPRPGDEAPLLLESLEDDSGAVVLSYRKAIHQVRWLAVCGQLKPGDVVTGPVVRKIKGGLLVNIGVNAFLPASQVDVRRPRDVAEYVGSTVECKVVTIDAARRNIVLSRRELLEAQRDQMKKKLLAEIEPGLVRQGVVKNITDFGAFVDLGGLEGLLHVSDMSWERVRNPRDVVGPEEHLEVYVLRVEHDRQRIALSLKHRTPNPWADAARKYPVGSRHTGEVVNVVGYGAFVKLEPGVEGLVHVSQMSWTRINRPSDRATAGDLVEVEVLALDEEAEEISLGMKQLTPNPWDKVAQRYPPGAVVTGVVRKLTRFGAFVELEPGLEGLLHVSELADHKVESPEDAVKVGDDIEV
jgi:small subunit ribosomal protein S1